jgi:putative glutamine amidotransferase
MPKPVIGVTCARISMRNGYPSHGAGQAYVAALAAAGGAPVLVPLGLDDETLENMLRRLDGVLFTGGGDVHPARYGSALIPQVNSIDEERDRIELRLLAEVVQSGKPFFGICRGLQLVNIGLGGTIYEDIAAQHPGSLKHDYFAPEWPREHLAHPVQVQPASALANLLQTSEAQVNSLHHQGIRRLAPGLMAAACAPDGVIEAIEVPDHPFGLAVQWHPENLQVLAPMRQLFQAFVQACAG